MRITFQPNKKIAWLNKALKRIRGVGENEKI